MLKIKDLKKTTLTERVEQEIRKAIIDSGLQIGDKLPGEMEFAERLKVSRPVVREALGRLRMLGICESRKCRGLILTEPNLLGGIESVIDLPVLTEKTRASLFQMRVMLEIGACAFCVTNKTDEDLAYLDELIKLEEANPEDIQLAMQCDIKFHTHLYQMAGNLLVQQFQGVLRPFMTNFSFTFRPDRFKENSEVISHRALLNELTHGTIDSFGCLMRQHFQPYIDFLNNSAIWKK